MSKENNWIKFLREQYPKKSRIRIRELETPSDRLPPKSMGTLVHIDDNGGFHVKWDKGMYSVINPGSDSFTVLEPELSTMKLYMPLCAEKINQDHYWNGEGEEFEALTASEILRGKDAILAAMMKYRSPEESERGIMYWFDEDEAVDRKVKSVFFTVEERKGDLWGVAECRVAGDLTPAEMSILKEYISGQASDGWGEGFEQQEISVDGEDIYVHLWSSEDWDIRTEAEQFPLKLAAGLPDLCFSTLASTGELICIKRGESGYYPSEWNTDDPAENKELAELNNQYLGVTNAQRQAMEVGSMVGWEVPGADPAAYESKVSEQENGGMQMGGP